MPSQITTQSHFTLPFHSILFCQIAGAYSYLDPKHKWQTVKYAADKNGFRVSASNLPKPRGDTPVVAAAKQKHHELYQKIAADHQRIKEERARLGSGSSESDEHHQHYGG